MTNKQIRNDILEHIKSNLPINIKNYKIFCEEFKGNNYAVVLSSKDNKRCILARCNDISNPTEKVLIISHGKNSANI